MENKTKLILTRRSQLQNRSRPYGVKIDKQEVGHIANGSAEEFLVEPGKHQLNCSILWYGSNDYEFEVVPGEILYLSVKNGMSYYWPAISLLFAGVLYNSFYGRYHREAYSFLYIGTRLAYLLPMLYLLYYISIGRRKYLVIEEDKNNIFAT